MGKTKKAKKARAKDEPYDASFAGSLAKLEAEGDVAAITDQKEDVKGMTKGELQRRQYLEWKRLRSTLLELGKEKRSYSNSDPAEKREKKDLRKYMIGLKTAMQERHQKELETWDTTRHNPGKT
ncbi:hypothetical protein DIPPA_10661 [Diplonema papillatum]|nr:hypothetical protein DIPPA_10661 [Diplonema papillatum]